MSIEYALDIFNETHGFMQHVAVYVAGHGVSAPLDLYFVCK